MILEEIQMYEDQPPFGADDKCRALHYGSHPLGRSVLGTAESIGDLPVEEMREYFRRRYSPGNIVLAAAGQIDFDRLVALARRCCGEWEPVETGRTVEPAAVGGGFHVLHKEIATQQYLLQVSAGPAAEDDDRYAAKLLATVLGDDSGSRLYWELVDPGLAEHVSLSHGEHQGAGMMLTYMSCDPEHTAGTWQRIGNSTAASRPRASRPRSWSRPRARFVPASCFPASGPAAGCSPSATIGFTAANIAPPRSTCRPSRRSPSTSFTPCWRNIRSPATTVTIGPLADLPQPAVCSRHTSCAVSLRVIDWTWGGRAAQRGLPYSTVSP